MKWFDGNIPAAIKLAKSQKSLFIVFITGDDEPSREMTKAWDEDAVSQLSLANNCVGLKLEAQSQAGLQFAQIYPVMIIPSVFFISPETGLPLEVSMGQVDAGLLLEKFNKALQNRWNEQNLAASSKAVHQQLRCTGVQCCLQPLITSYHNPMCDRQMQPSTLPSASSGGASAAAAAAPVVSAANAETQQEASGGSNVTENTQASSGATCDELAAMEEEEELRVGETLEERKERLLKKIAERQELKAKQEEENEKKREMERRKLGQETQKFRQWKADMEKKEYANSYKKEKEEQRRALEKVRADLELDRQERAQRFKQDKELQEEAVERAKKAKLEAEAKRLEKDNATKRESSRVQFRMPDGSSVTQVFSATDTLSTAKSFIQQKLNNKPVTLSTTYPKRMFVESDMARTLLDLELVPSSVLIVLPETSKGNRLVASSETDSTSFLWMLLAPLLALWNFIYNFLFPAVPPVNSQGNQNVDSGQTNPSDNTRSRNVKQQPRSQGLRNRKDGNINRLTADDEDDDAATWNGNSTQQM